MSRVLQYLPDVSGDEQIVVAELLKPMDDTQAETFAHVYRNRRKDPTVVLILTLVGFLGLAGLQRFYTDRIVLGLLYLVTWGFCGVGIVLDAIRYKKVALAYNQEQAHEVAEVVRESVPDERSESNA